MSEESSGGAPSGVAWLRTGAYLVLVVAGLKAAGAILIPILLALLLTIICIPGTRWLRRLGLPMGLAIPVVVVGLLVLMVLLVTLLGSSVAEFSGSVDKYEERLDGTVDSVVDLLGGLGVDVAERQVDELIDSKEALAFVASAAGSVTATLSDLLIVVFFVVFMLAEAGGMPDKLRRAVGDPEADLAGFHGLLDQVYGYLSIKTLVSLLTGVLAGGFCAVMGVDFPVLWGLVAFLFNFIPTVGSILAALPPVMLALIQHGPGTMLVVFVGYLVINVAIGSVLEPRIMGQRLGLSPLVVLISLLFWSWVWGPVGMLLSVPLTTVVKIMLESGQETRPVAILLGPVGEED